MNEFQIRMNTALREITAFHGQFSNFAGETITPKDKEEIDHTLRILEASIQQDIINGKPPLEESMREVNTTIVLGIITRLSKSNTGEARAFSKKILAILDKAKIY